MKKLTLAALLGILSSAGPALADDAYTELPSLVRAVNIGTTAVPNIVARYIIPVFNVAKDANDWPTKMTFAFDLYDPTSATPTTKLFRTTKAKTDFAAMPCSNPGSFNYDFRPKFFGRWASGRETIVMNMYVECNEMDTWEHKESYKTFVYSVPLANATQAPWTKTYNTYLIGADALDLTDGSGNFGVQDGSNETLMLSMDAPNNTVRIVMIDFKTGELFSNPAVTMPSNQTFSIGNP